MSLGSLGELRAWYEEHRDELEFDRETRRFRPRERDEGDDGKDGDAGDGR